MNARAFDGTNARPDSWLSRITTAPGRLLCCIALVIGIATCPLSGAGTLASAILFGAAAIAIAPAPRPFLRRLAYASLVVVALVGPFYFSVGASAALARGGRALLASATALCFAATLKPTELGPAMRGIGVPAKLSSIISVMMRQLTQLGEEGRRLLLARKLRGATGMIGPDVLASLLVRSSRRAEKLELALTLRGSAATGAIAMTAADRAAAASCALAAIATQLIVRAVH